VSNNILSFVFNIANVNIVLPETFSKNVIVFFIKQQSLHFIFTFIHLADTFYPKRLKNAIYVRGRTQLGVKCLAQGHIGVSQWIRTRVHCAITTTKAYEFVFLKRMLLSSC